MTDDEARLLLLDVAAIRHDVAQLLAVIIPRDPLADALRAAYGDAAFTSAEVINDANSGESPDLVDALQAAGIVDARGLGDYLSGLAARGLVQRIKACSSGLLWGVVTSPSWRL